jgi:hypothetical protein
MSSVNDWIYLGRNYAQLKRLEITRAGDRISLRHLNQTIHFELINEFLEWLEKQREINSDSLTFWMTHVAGKNNMWSEFYSRIVQVVALRRWVQEHSQEDRTIHVVCENAYVAQVITTGLSDLVGVRCGHIDHAANQAEKLGYIFLSCFKFIAQLKMLLKHWLVSRIDRPTRVVAPPEKLYLVHQCLDNAAFARKDSLECRYLTIVPKWLEKQNKNVIKLPWLDYVSLPLRDVYRRLREEGCLIPEDWLTLWDYVVVARQHLSSAFSINPNQEFVGLKLQPLVLAERRQQIGDRGMLFWRYKPMLDRWGVNLKELVFIDHFEGLIVEHVPIYIGRSLKCKFKAIGYVPVPTVPTAWLAMHFRQSTWVSQIMPDTVVVSGHLAKKTLVHQGVPEDRIKIGPALRQDFTTNRERTLGWGRNIVVFLSLSISSSVELMREISVHSGWLKETLGLSIKLRCHPMVKKTKLLRAVGWQELPAGWQWAEAPLIDVLEKTDCVISHSTGSVIDAILKDCMIILIDSELEPSWNYLDCLVDVHEILKPIPIAQLPTRLTEFFGQDRPNIRAEFLRIQIKLRDGLEQITEETLANFL